MPAYTMAQQSPRTESPLPFRKPEISEKPAFLMQQQPSMQQRRISPVRSPSPAPQQQYQQQQQQQPQAQPNRPAQSRWNNSPAPQQEQPNKPLTVYNNVAKPNPTAPVQSAPHSAPMNGQVKPTPQKPAHVGSLYIPPVEPQDMYSNKQNVGQPQNVVTPNWMQSRGTPGEEVPEWVNQTEDRFPFAQHKVQQQPPNMQVEDRFPFAQQKTQQQPPNMQQVYQEAVNQQQQQPPRVVYQQQQQQQPQSHGQQRQGQTSSQEQTTTTTSSSTSHRERIIPIQLEQTPTPTKCPTSPGFGPQPFYNMGQQQYSSVQSPGGTLYANNSPSE